jgi:hypothetical protein
MKEKLYLITITNGTKSNNRNLLHRDNPKEERDKVTERGRERERERERERVMGGGSREEWWKESRQVTRRCETLKRNL